MPGHNYPPPLPHSFWGKADEAWGHPARIGTIIEARIKDDEGNLKTFCFKMTEVGKFGGVGPDDPRLVVKDIYAEDRTPIEFYVNGKQCLQICGYWPGNKTEIVLERR